MRLKSRQENVLVFNNCPSRRTKEKTLHFSIITLTFLLVTYSFLNAQQQTSFPRRIILNLTENPSTSVAVNWQDRIETSRGYVQYTVERVNPDFEDSVKTIYAKQETITYKDDDTKKDTTLKFYSATIDNLSPSTKYVYRVGDSIHWCEWIQFTTAGTPDDKYSFIYFGDAQNNIKSKWSRVIRQAFMTCPDAGFLYHAGDLINRDCSTKEWDEWFYSGSFIHSMVPSVMTPGNHEYGRGMILDPQWDAQFNLPKNGPENHKERVFYSDYNNLRIISLDADLMDESNESLESQKRWLETVLSNNPQKWTVLTLHFPFYSTKENRDNPKLRENFKPLIDKYGVDLVLTGHDHAYGRGMHTIESSIPGQQSNTMYVVSVSGPKQYDLSDKSWMTRKAGNTQFYNIIMIEGDTLNFKAYMVNGDLYDEFDLIKKEGKPNKLVNKIPDVPERLYTR